MRYSFIIPVYNRPEELQELLESIMRQSLGDYEVIVVEDGSTRTSEEVIQRFIPQIYSLYYYQIPNGGPSRARNIGANYAKGDYIIILDSDVVLPEGYLLAVDKALSHGDIDAFGGPDTASEDFTPIQKAINYAMTSTLTTGGIRGGSADAMEQFKPRSFNLGCRRALFLQLGGFDVGMRFGEDIDFSLRLQEAGARTVLIPEAYVYHKRRVDLRRFFKQVHNSGIARIHLETRHPGSTRLVHCLPALFTILSALIIIAWVGTRLFLRLRCMPCVFHSSALLSFVYPIAILSGIGMALLALLALLFFIDAYQKTKDTEVALWAVPACFIQLWGYGSGFVRAWWGKHILRRREFTAFRNNFYD